MIMNQVNNPVIMMMNTVKNQVMKEVKNLKMTVNDKVIEWKWREKKGMKCI